MTISEQIQVISDKVDLISQNYQHSINLTVSLISLSIAIAGVALYKITRMWVDKRVDNELDRIKDEIKEDCLEFILNQNKYIIRAWDNAVVTTSKMINGEMVYFIPVHGGTENVLYPPIVSLYKKNSIGEKTPVVNYSIVEELEHYPKKEGENVIYICIKEKNIDGGFSYIVMWEKDVDNKKARL